MNTRRDPHPAYPAGGGVGQSAGARDVVESFMDRTLAKPLPTAGDHLTLYTYEEASPFLDMSPATIRRHVATGGIPRDLITKHPGRKGRVYMTGDQIVRCLALFATGPTPTTPVGRPYTGRRARVA